MTIPVKRGQSFFYPYPLDSICFQFRKNYGLRLMLQSKKIKAGLSRFDSMVAAIVTD
jgi:hypothetical protein